MTSSAFAAPAVLRIGFSGFPSAAGNSLKIELLEDRHQLVLRPLEDPGSFWQSYEFELPAKWRGKQIRYVVERSSTSVDQFWGFTEPEPEPSGTQTMEALTIAARTCLSWLLLFLPGGLLAMLLVERNCTDRFLLCAAMLGAIGLWGYVSFWIWFLSPLLGQIVAAAFAVAAFAYLTLRLRSLTLDARRLLGKLLFPALLTLAVSLFVLSTGFLYGGAQSPFDTAATRFSSRLPPDNQLPYLFATAVAHGNVPKPLAGEWHSSDRPPLQTGLYLAQYTLARGRLGYTIAGVLAQSLWAFGLASLLGSLRLSRGFIALTLLVLTFSGFALLHSFYVWPKLLAAAFTLAFSAFVLSSEYRAQLKVKQVSVLAGALLACAMLSHGGAVFGVLGLLVLLPCFTPKIPARSLAGLAIVTFAVYLPWFLYQTYFDSPGNHLVKMHLAGVSAIDGRSLGQALADSYRQLTTASWLAARFSNLAALAGPESGYWSDLTKVFSSLSRANPNGWKEAHAAANRLRVDTFYFLLPCLGPLVLGPFALLTALWLNRHRHDTKMAFRLLMLVLMSLLLWCTLMFTGGSTVLHQGSYSVVILAFSGALLGAWSLSPRLAMVLGTLHIGFDLLFYFVLLRPLDSPQVLYSGRFSGPLAIVAFAAICLVAVLLRRELLSPAEPAAG